MRICIVNEFFWPDTTGGTGTVVSELARTVRENYPDIAIDVVTSRNLYRTPPRRHHTGASVAALSDNDAEKMPSLPRRQIWEGIRIERLATPRPNSLPTPLRLAANLMFSYAALMALLRAGKYDLVLVATAPPMAALAANLYRTITGTPYVYTVYDLEPDRAVVLKLARSNHWAVRILRRYQRRWLRSADRVVVLGRCMRDYVVAAYGVVPDRVDVIPVGADDREIRPLDKNTAIRAAMNLDGFVVLYSGNFGRYHDFDTILNAAKRLAEVRSDVKFVLVGAGWQRDKIARRVEDEQIGNVLVKPFVTKEDYPDLLASADVSLVTLEPGMDGLCVPSKFYSILASGRPTIAVVPASTEVGRTIEEAQCGLRIDHGDTQALVDAVLDMAQNSALAEAMGRNARAVLVERYSTQSVARAFRDVFVKTLGGDASEIDIERESAHFPSEALEEAEVLPNY